MKIKSRIFVLPLLMMATVPLLLPAGAQQRTKRTDPNTYYRAPHTMAGKMIILPIGTTFEGRINKTISSQKSHAGESFSIVLSAPVLANGVDVVIPAGSEVMGEVVEAISSSSQPHKKNMPKPKGKLRVQITQLRTPDGTAFPLVANLVGEQDTKMGHGRSGLQTPLGSGVAYVGTAEAFEAVAPGSNRYGKQVKDGRGPDFVKKREFLSHEIYGSGGDPSAGVDDRRIRSLVLRKMDLWIDDGSPLTLKLQAPLRISVTPNAIGAPVGNVEQDLSSDDALPGPTPGGGGADIPPITGNDNSQQNRRRPADAPPPTTPAPGASTPPAQAQPNPNATPSSEF